MVGKRWLYRVRGREGEGREGGEGARYEESQGASHSKVERLHFSKGIGASPRVREKGERNKC